MIRRATVLLLFLLISTAEAKPLAGIKTATTGFCGTSNERTAVELALDRYHLRKTGYAATVEPLPITNDQGNIAVMEDDGTLITQPNFLDLANRAITFTPVAGGYSIASGASAFQQRATAATTLQLDDDDSKQVELPFAFPFFGRSYTSVFVNTDGNLTFNSGDSASTERDLQRMYSGTPRVSPLFDDLNPTNPARITFEGFADRVVVTWTDIGEWTEAGSTGHNNFQAILQSNGVIRFNYLTVDALQAVIGIGPGGQTLPIDLADLSAQTGLVTFRGLVSEVFAVTQKVSLSAVAQYFYRSHADVYDSLMVFTDFGISLDDAFAFTINVRNATTGIADDPDFVFDAGRSFGSTTQLQAMSNMGWIGQYPLDPQRRFLGEYNSLGVFSHEFAHRWLSFVDTRDEVLLGRQHAHWSFFNNTTGSFMDGNEIQDLGGGRFRTTAAVYHYSAVDQYLMGLRSAGEVPPWFVVTQPSFTALPESFLAGCASTLNACNPYVGLDFNGTRRNVTLDEVIDLAGPRVPATSVAPHDFRVGFILLTQKGRTASSTSITKLDSFRAAWEPYFQSAIDGRGTLRTNLVTLQPTVTVDGTIAANGIKRIETAGTSSTTRVGYARLDSTYAAAVFRSRQGTQIVSEAAVPASPASTSFVTYIERTPDLSTGLAIVNAGTSTATVTIQLSSGLQSSVSIPAGGQTSKFIHEYVPSMDASFSGTALIQSNVPIAVAALRGTLAATSSFIITTVPLTSRVPPKDEITMFPQIADGGGYSTEMVLINPATTSIKGAIEFSMTVATDRGEASRFVYDIPARGAWKMRTQNVGSVARAGFATLLPDAGFQRPEASAIFSLTANGVLQFQAGVPAQPGLNRVAMFAVRQSSERTVLAISRGKIAAEVRATAYDANGVSVVSAKPLTIPADGHVAAFIDELIPELPDGFQGTLILESAVPLHTVTLRTLTSASNSFIMTPMPTIDPATPPPTPGYLPQLADGGNFTTDILLMNIGPSAFHVAFFAQDGQALPLPLR